MLGSGQMALNIMIGAALSGGFRSSFSGARSEMTRLADGSTRLGAALDVADRKMHGMSGSANDLQGSLAQMGQAVASLMVIRGAVNMAGDLEHRLAGTGITADMTSDRLRELRNRLRELAVPESTNKSVDQLERGFNRMVAAGMEADKAQAALLPVGRTATATSAAIDDLADTSYVITEILGVAPDALTAEMDRLAYAGNRGAFELEHMARYFPMLGAGAKALKMEGSDAVGTLAASLQIAKRGAADPGEAANNMANFMKSLTSPETLKNAKQAGINIKKIIRKAWEDGENPLLAVLDAVKAKTGGDPFKIGQIFRDTQVQNYLKPVLADLEELKSLKRDIMTKSGGTVDSQFAIMMATYNEKTAGFRASLEKLGDSVGRSFLAPLGAVVSMLTPLVNLLSDAADTSPTFTFTLLAMGAALTVLPPAIALIGMAWRSMSTSIVATPIGAAIVLIGLGAAYLIDHWTPVQEFFKGIWEPVKPYWDAFVGWVGGVWEKLRPMFETVGKWMGIGASATAGPSTTSNAESSAQGAGAPGTAGGKVAAPGSAAGAGKPGALLP
ncbi:phage tail tape measure protein, partial [Nitratidesulfovibrio liaohensis]|uniref:phage tail tape measure protein n=1 Tax=Nitratidesulfovibrio liaohensis TaxID=2604158 RepID=UPI001421387C|nr:phage tail tape measure protein [Nitratidesulfovibrio liaohensis]